VQTAPQIVVIGAGLSGLTAAYRLLQRGYDVVIYEARPRVGGRVLSAVMQGSSGKLSVIELGGEMITDGGEAHNIRVLLDELALPIIDMQLCPGYLRYFDGKSVSMPEINLSEYGFTDETLWSHLLKLNAQSCCMDDVLKMLFANDQHLYEFFSLRLACYEGGPVSKLSATYISTLHHMMLRGVNAVPDGIIRLQKIDGGNSRLAEALALRLNNRIYLNEQLCKIDKLPDDQFALTFQNGSVVYAETVVLTIPCTVYENIEFGEGVISPEQLTNICSIEYGENAKVWTAIERSRIDATFATERFFARTFRDSECAVLYYRGPYGAFSQATLADIIARDVCVVPFTQGALTHNAALARDENFAVYTGIVGKSWPMDPYAKGSYSYINAGQEERFTAIEDYRGEQVRSLFAPAGKLFFAGEHTTILLDVLGTMEAAVESGERIARIIESSFSE